MGSENNSYKILQVFSVFINRYGFKQTIFKGMQEMDHNELWLSNFNDPNYQVIRISDSRARFFLREKSRIEKVLKAFGREFKKDSVSFLDIYISEDSYNEEYEEYDYLNLEINHADGKNVFNFYPEIYSAVEEVEDSEKEIKKIIENILMIKQNKEKAKPFFERKYPFLTYGCIALCVILYIAYILLSRNYSDGAVYIFLGADYKTFTLGLRQFYRLFSCAFLHGSILHLISNMYSLFFVGGSLEKLIGIRKYLAVGVFSTLIASLSQGIMSENSILLGMSGAIYGMFVYLALYLYYHQALSWKMIMPVILINIYLNFLSTTAWLAHLGGALAGMIMYMIFNQKNKIGPMIMLIVVVVFMFYRYVTIKTINPFYQGTDIEVANMYYELGFKNYSKNILSRLLNVYKNYGG